MKNQPEEYSHESGTLLVPPEKSAGLKAQSKDWPSWELNERQLCDLELLLNGGFAPLKGFPGTMDYENILNTMHLTDGHLWPMPITLDVSEAFAEKVSPGQKIALRDAEGVMLAALYISDLWRPERTREMMALYGTDNPDHPGVAMLKSGHPVYIGGKVEGLQMPLHYDFVPLRLTPAETKAEFARLGWRKIISFQVKNVIHRQGFEFSLKTAKNLEANLLIHPVVGLARPGDLDHYTRIHCYEKALEYYPQPTVRISLLPLAERFAGTREAIWRGLVAKNYGCTHFFVDHDLKSHNEDIFGALLTKPCIDEKVLKKAEEESGMIMIPHQSLAYVEDQDAYLPEEKIPVNARVLHLSGAELRDRLADGRSVPEWFTFPEIAQVLRQAHPPRYKQGFTVFFTGLSGSGKSTIANVLLVRLLQMGDRPVTLLDGDIVRKHLSSELTFTREHRDINIRRIGFVASEITKNGGIAICAPIAPFDSVRKEVRRMVEKRGGFILVHVATPLEICESRDRKGLYAKARAGIVKAFTGISDPYEAPTDADMHIDTTAVSPFEAAQEIILHLEQKGYIGAAHTQPYN